MATPMLATKLYIPTPRRDAIARPRLVERLDGGSSDRLTLISAPAGFGKTTLLSAWLARRSQPAAWLSLDEGDSDPARFLTDLIAAVRLAAPDVGAGALAALQASPVPPAEALLTALLNDIAALPDPFTLVLDDYHACAGPSVDQAIAFLLDHLPPQLRLVLATREDPHLPLARLRASDQLTELRAADLRFTGAEASVFLTHVMGLALSAEDIAALETRTEGWIAGLQLAAISLRGHPDSSGFIASFTGSHHFVLDYLVEEVLRRQPERIQTFLLRTAALDRLCGRLCDAALLNHAGAGQETLEYIERANLFLVPLDDERRWYRYHHLFADLLRQRLGQSAAAAPGDDRWDVAAIHRRASVWYEEQGMDVEAFQQAAAARDIARTARLLEGGGMPLHFRGAVAPVLGWLASLPQAELDARPALWVMYASALSMAGQLNDAEEKLHSAEGALRDTEMDVEARNLTGHIAAIRALLAASRNQVDVIIAQSHRALEYLRPDNLPVRTATIWKLGLAYQLQGDRVAARQAYTEAIAISQASGNQVIALSASAGLAAIQEADTQLMQAADTYQRILAMVGEAPLLAASAAHFGLTRIRYEWNELDAALEHARQSIGLAPWLQSTDSGIALSVLLARLKLAQGDVASAATMLAEASQSARQLNLVSQFPEIAAVHARILVRQGNLVKAAQLAQTSELPLIQARVSLAQGDPMAALAALEPWRARAEENGWADERLKALALRALALRALALQAQGERRRAEDTLLEALALAEPGGFIRTFADEGAPMAELLTSLTDRGGMSAYIGKLLAAFKAEERTSDAAEAFSSSQPLIEPLSRRELEVMRLIAAGLSNQEISERLVVALDTVKGHNQRIFAKLQVQRRTEAVARARELGLL
jgi:LuxR family maltose regulon positive regulatory protein